MHKVGIGHNDVKPENLMINADGVVCLIDYGSASDAGKPISLFSQGLTIQYALKDKEENPRIAGPK